MVRILGRAISSGHAFISADYCLLPPATGHDIVKDIQDLFAFLKDPLLSFTMPSKPGDEQSKFKVDPESIVVSGSSAGGFCAYLAAINCVSPKPKAILSLYGMGGDLLVGVNFYKKISSKGSLAFQHNRLQPTFLRRRMSSFGVAKYWTKLIFKNFYIPP